MTCTTAEDFNSAIEFGTIINDIRSGQEAEATVRFLDLTSEHVLKIEGKYQTFGGTATLKQSVTEKVGKKFPFQGERKQIYERQAHLGVFIHSITENIAEQIVDKLGGHNSLETNMRIVREFTVSTEGLKKIQEDYMQLIKPHVLQNIQEGIKQTILNIYKVQRTINTLTCIS